jgi:hypothetical protein
MRLLRVALALGLICTGSSGASALTYGLVALGKGGCGGASCPLAIVGTGEIAQDEFERFQSFVASVAPVVGELRDGSIGRGFCGSACVFVLMGGRTRTVAPGSTVAVHSPRRVAASIDPEAVGSTELASGFRDQVLQGLTDYARGMGVDPALIRLSMTVPHHSRRVLTAAEIRRFRLASASGRR